MGNSARALIAFGYDLGEAHMHSDFLKKIENMSDSEDCPVEVVYHNHHEYRIPAVIRKATLTTVYAGSPRDLPLAIMDSMVRYEDASDMYHWCRDNDIPWRAPSWMVMADYG